MKLHSIHAGTFKLDGGAMFGVVPKSLWNKLIPADEHNLCTWAMRCLLIEDGNRLILVDTGIGDKQDARFFSHYQPDREHTLEASIRNAGFAPADVTDVLLTHLHFDHVGGAITRRDDRLELTFPNATYWSNEQHWNWATNPNEREKASFLPENILPLQESGRLQFVHSPMLTNTVSLRFVYGHTESMMLPQIEYNNTTVVFMADLLPSVAHLPIPYVMAYDMFPLTTLEEKKSFLTEALEKDYVLFFEHDANVECCRLQQTDKGIRAKETFRLSDL